MRRYLLASLLLSTIFLGISLETSALQTSYRVPSRGVISHSRNNIFGVNVNWGYDVERYDILFDRISELGVGWVRWDFDWYSHEDPKGVFHWPRLDRVVNNARARGMEVLPIFVYTPNWASGTNDYMEPPRDMGDFKNFVKKCVERYGFKVVEIWPEPAYFFHGTAEQYVALTRAGYEGAKEVNPNCVVVGGYGGGPIFSPYYDPYGEWYSIGNLVDLGILNYCDALTIHPYTADTPPEDMIPKELKQLRNFLTERGKGNFRLWATEFGYGLGDQPPAGGHTLESQADFTVRAMRLLFDDPYIDMVCYFTFWGSPQSRDFSMVEEGWNSNSRLTPRPVFYSYQNFIFTRL